MNKEDGTLTHMLSVSDNPTALMGPEQKYTNTHLFQKPASERQLFSHCGLLVGFWTSGKEVNWLSGRQDGDVSLVMAEDGEHQQVIFSSRLTELTVKSSDNQSVCNLSNYILKPSLCFSSTSPIQPLPPICAIITHLKTIFSPTLSFPPRDNYDV